MKKIVLNRQGKLTAGVRLPRADKLQVLERHAVRPQDIEPCVDCFVPADPAIRGYDKKWRCLKCNQTHMDAVLGESGDSAPNDSEDMTKTTLAVKPGQVGNDARKAILDRFGKPLPPTAQEEISQKKAAAAKAAGVAASASSESLRESIRRKYGLNKRSE